MPVPEEPLSIAVTKSPHEYAKLSFPSLVLSDLSDVERDNLQSKLYSDSVGMMGKFQDLLNTIMDSLETRKVPVKKILTRIMAFGAFVPVYQGSKESMLEHELIKLRDPETSIDDIQCVVTKYSSFFNYHIVEQIVKTLGTPDDKRELEKYECAFKEYAKRKVYECPSELGTADDTTQVKIFIKLDDSYDKCSLSHLKLFTGKLSEVFSLQGGVLQLVTVNLGCFELIFQVPLLLQDTIFPLSIEQEEMLMQWHVLKFSCGQHTFTPVYKNSDGLDLDDDRKDGSDDESGIGISTAVSELTEISQVSS